MQKLRRFIPKHLRDQEWTNEPEEVLATQATDDSVVAESEVMATSTTVISKSSRTKEHKAGPSISKKSPRQTLSLKKMKPKAKNYDWNQKDSILDKKVEKLVEEGRATCIIQNFFTWCSETLKVSISFNIFKSFKIKLFLF